MTDKPRSARDEIQFARGILNTLRQCGGVAAKVELSKLADEALERALEKMPPVSQGEDD